MSYKLKLNNQEYVCSRTKVTENFSSPTDSKELLYGAQISNNNNLPKQYYRFFLIVASTFNNLSKAEYLNKIAQLNNVRYMGDLENYVIELNKLKN